MVEALELGAARAVTYECGCVEQSAPGAHARPISHGVALKALPGRMAGARLMADQHQVRAERG